MEDFGVIEVVYYHDELLNTPEAPQAAGNDKPIHGPSHQSSVGIKYPYFSDISAACE